MNHVSGKEPCIASFVFLKKKKKNANFFVIFKCMYLCVLVCGYVGPGTQGGQRHWVLLSLKLQAAVNYAMWCWEWTEGLC